MDGPRLVEIPRRVRLGMTVSHGDGWSTRQHFQSSVLARDLQGPSDFRSVEIPREYARNDM